MYDLTRNHCSNKYLVIIHLDRSSIKMQSFQLSNSAQTKQTHINYLTNGIINFQTFNCAYIAVHEYTFRECYL